MSRHLTSIPAQLPTALELYDVRDVEALARRVIDERLREWGARLETHLAEDALAFLIVTAWELSLDHDGARSSFSRRCYRTLRLRLVDWYRQTFGDSRHAPRPIMLSLEHELDTAPIGNSGIDGAADERSRPSSWTEAIADDSANVEEAVFHSAAFGLEWADLSLASFRTMEEIGRRLEAGKSLEAIARELGESRRSVKTRLELLQAEILAKRPDLPEWLDS